MGIQVNRRRNRSSQIWLMEELEPRLAAGTIVAPTPWGISGPLPPVVSIPALASAAAAVRIAPASNASPSATVAPRAPEPTATSFSRAPLPDNSLDSLPDDTIQDMADPHKRGHDDPLAWLGSTAQLPPLPATNTLAMSLPRAIASTAQLPAKHLDKPIHTAPKLKQYAPMSARHPTPRHDPPSPITSFGITNGPTFSAGDAVNLDFEVDTTDMWNWSWQIDWGDGAQTTGDVSNDPSGVYSHAYVQPGAYTVTATIDAMGGPDGFEEEQYGQQSTAADIQGLQLSAPFSIVPGEPFAADLEFIGFGSAFPSTSRWGIDWGDGSYDTGTAATLGLQTHTYDNAGEYNVITGFDHSGDLSSPVQTQFATDGFYPADVSISGNAIATAGSLYGVSLSATEGSGVSWWSVDWGDGNTDDWSGDTFTYADHTYASGGPYAISATAHAGTQSFNTAPFNAAVNSSDGPTLTVEPINSAVENSEFDLSVSQDGSSTVDTWYITWGDGSGDWYYDSVPSPSHTYTSYSPTQLVTASMHDNSGWYQKSILITEQEAAPSDLTASTVNDGNVQLSWTSHSTDQSEYLVSVNQPDGTLYGQYDVPPDQTSYTVTGLDQNTTYSFSVQSEADDGSDSDPSNTATALTLFTAPSIAESWPNDDGTMNFSWIDNTGGNANYAIYGDDGHGNRTLITTASAGQGSVSGVVVPAIQSDDTHPVPFSLEGYGGSTPPGGGSSLGDLSGEGDSGDGGTSDSGNTSDETDFVNEPWRTVNNTNSTWQDATTSEPGGVNNEQFIPLGFPGNGTVEGHIHDLPGHSELLVTFGTFAEGAQPGATQTVTVSASGKTGVITYTLNTDYTVSTQFTGGIGQGGDSLYRFLVPHTDDSADVTITGSGYGANNGFGVWFADAGATRPTVSISPVKDVGTELDDPTLTFRVTRSDHLDAPLVVQFDKLVGPAIKSHRISETIPPVTIPAGEDHVDFTLQITDDEIAEGDQNFVIPIKGSTDGLYAFGQNPVRVTGTVKDNAQVHSVTVYRKGTLNGPFSSEVPDYNKVYGYGVGFWISVRGEGLDKVTMEQHIFNTLSIDNWDGTPETPAQLDADVPRGDPRLPHNSAGSPGANALMDSGWPSGLDMDDPPTNGVAHVLDNHSLPIPRTGFNPTLAKIADFSIHMTDLFFATSTYANGSGPSLFQKDWGYRWYNINCLTTGQNPALCASDQVGSGKGQFTQTSGVVGLTAMN